VSLQNLYRNASIKNKLIFAFVGVIALLLVVSAVALITQLQARAAMNELRLVGENVTNSALRARFSLIDAHSYQKEYIIYYNEVGIAEADRRFAPVVDNYIATVRESLEVLRGSDIAENAEIDHVMQLLTIYETAFDNARAILRERGTGRSGDGVFADIVRTRAALRTFMLDNGYYEDTSNVELFQQQLEFETVYFMDLAASRSAIDQGLSIVERIGQIAPPEGASPETHETYL